VRSLTKTEKAHLTNLLAIQWIRWAFNAIGRGLRPARLSEQVHNQLRDTLDSYEGVELPPATWTKLERAIVDNARQLLRDHRDKDPYKTVLEHFVARGPRYVVQRIPQTDQGGFATFTYFIRDMEQGDPPHTVVATRRQERHAVALAARLNAGR
jgi:hypothetical protein